MIRSRRCRRRQPPAPAASRPGANLMLSASSLQRTLVMRCARLVAAKLRAGCRRKVPGTGCGRDASPTFRAEQCPGPGPGLSVLVAMGPLSGHRFGPCHYAARQQRGRQMADPRFCRRPGKARPGLRIHEYLAQRADIEVLSIDTERRKDLAERARLLNHGGREFLCLPDDAARGAAAMVSNPRHLPHRRQHRAPHRAGLGLRYPSWPGAAQAHPRRQTHRQPGLPCQRLHPVAAPAGRRGHRLRSLPVSATSITGYSGGGKKMIERTSAATTRCWAPRPYGWPGPEAQAPARMRVAWRPAVEPAVFMPVVGNRLLQGAGGDGAAELQLFNWPRAEPGPQRALAQRYEGERFIPRPGRCPTSRWTEAASST